MPELQFLRFAFLCDTHFQSHGMKFCWSNNVQSCISTFRDLLLIWGGRFPGCDCPPCRGHSSWSFGRRSSWRYTPWPAPSRRGEGSQPESGAQSSQRPWGRGSEGARRGSFWGGWICKDNILVLRISGIFMYYSGNNCYTLQRFSGNIIEKFQFTLVQLCETETGNWSRKKCKHFNYLERSGIIILANLKTRPTTEIPMRNIHQIQRTRKYFWLKMLLLRMQR